MSLLDDFVRVTRQRPCPICEKPDWCLVARDNPSSPSAAICARIESHKRFGKAGWHHRMREDESRFVPGRWRTIRIPVGPLRTAEMADLAARYQDAVELGHLNRFASGLGLGTSSLRHLSIGWCGWAWSFPMCDGSGAVRGIRLRKPDGQKLAVRGSREGLFVARGLEQVSRLLVCEGPTDTAALLDLGLDALGRPSCGGGSRLVLDFVRAVRPEEVVVVADADGPGQRGAESLLARLLPVVPNVRILHPPGGVKDARDWKRRGANRDKVERAIEESPIRRLDVRVRRVGGRS